MLESSGNEFTIHIKDVQQLLDNQTLARTHKIDNQSLAKTRHKIDLRDTHHINSHEVFNYNEYHTYDEVCHSIAFLFGLLFSLFVNYYFRYSR